MPLLLQILPFLLAGCAIAFLTAFLYIKVKITMRQKEAEQAILQDYMHYTENHPTAMRKLVHDYQNILLPVYGFVQTEDWAGLKEYMPKIKEASAIIAKGEFALEGLCKINVREVRVLLAAKLTQAQNLGISTAFEAHEEIDHINADSVALIRMLGIVLDNAIEELDALGTGELLVACYKVGDGVTFVVQNTCRAGIPPLHELERPGFSHKGRGRGLGLSNLAELVAGCDNIALQTDIEGGNFTQKLCIGGDNFANFNMRR